MHRPVFYARHLLRLSNMKKKRDAARQARDVHRVKKKSRTLSGKKVDARTYSGSRQMVDRKQHSTIIAEPRTSRKDGGRGGGGARFNPSSSLSPRVHPPLYGRHKSPRKVILTVFYTAAPHTLSASTGSGKVSGMLG